MKMMKTHLFAWHCHLAVNCLPFLRSQVIYGRFHCYSLLPIPVGADINISTNHPAFCTWRVSHRRMLWDTAPKPGTEFHRSMLKYWWLEIITSEVNVLLLTVIKKNKSAVWQKSAEKICKEIAGETSACWLGCFFITSSKWISTMVSFIVDD